MTGWLAWFLLTHGWVLLLASTPTFLWMLWLDGRMPGRSLLQEWQMSAPASASDFWDESGSRPRPKGSTECPWCRFWHFPEEEECPDAPPTDIRTDHWRTTR